MKNEDDQSRVDTMGDSKDNPTAASNEAIRAAMQAHVDSALSAPPPVRVESLTRLSYWFPLIAAAGLPVPATRFVWLTPVDAGELISLFDGETPKCFDRLVEDIRAAGAEFGTPFFLRTDFTSGKHSWVDTCFVTDPRRIGHHVAGLVEFSEIADMFGGMPADVFVVREFLPTTPAFVAFHGMPITREFRFFVRDGVIEHWQPYWPSGAFEYSEPSDPDWREKLANMSALPDSEYQELARLTQQASAAVPGFWSVDWLHVVGRGWVLTDMAEGEKSYRWELDSDAGAPNQQRTVAASDPHAASTGKPPTRETPSSSVIPSSTDREAPQ